jgi:hypothetical protein
LEPGLPITNAWPTQTGLCPTQIGTWAVWQAERAGEEARELGEVNAA